MAAYDEIKDDLRRVHAWISSHLTRFDPFEEKDKKRFDARMKAFVELCFYDHLAARFGNTHLIPDSVRAFVSEAIAGPQMLRLLLAKPSNATRYITATLASPNDERLRSIWLHYRHACKPLNDERAPFETLAHVYNLETLGFYGDDVAEIERRALAVSALSIIAGNITAPAPGPYAFTHSAYYATRFGSAKPVAEIAPADALARYIDIELSKAFAQKDMDLALELVLARLCLFGALSEKDLVVLESARALLAKNGRVLAPKQSTFAEGDPDWEWYAAYHTMLILGILLLRLEALGDIPLACDSCDDDRAMQTAREMDLVGTLFAAAENGNFPLAVRILAKLDEMPADMEPGRRLLDPVFDYVASVHAVLEENNAISGKTAELMGMSADAFVELMGLCTRIFAIRKIAFTCAREPQSREYRALL